MNRRLTATVAILVLATAVSFLFAYVRPRQASFEPDFSPTIRTMRGYRVIDNNVWRFDDYVVPNMSADDFGAVYGNVLKKFVSSQMVVGLDPAGGHASGAIDDSKNDQHFYYIILEDGTHFTYSRRVSGGELAYGWIQVHLLHKVHVDRPKTYRVIP